MSCELVTQLGVCGNPLLLRSEIPKNYYKKIKIKIQDFSKFPLNMSSFSMTLSYVCPHLMVLGQSYVCHILNLLDNVVLSPFSSPGITGHMSLADVQHFFYFRSFKD